MYYVKQPIEQFARRSVELIINKLEGKEEEVCTKIVLEPQIEITEC